MTITGSIKAQILALKAAQISAPVARSEVVKLRDLIHHMMHRATPIKRPGTIPAIKSWEMETPAVTPMTMNGIDGGMIGAMMPPAAIKPAEPGPL